MRWMFGAAAAAFLACAAIGPASSGAHPFVALPAKPGLVPIPAPHDPGMSLPYRVAQADTDAKTKRAASSDADAPVLPRNQPTDVQGVMAVCTGIDDDSRKDARWESYPLKLEFAAANGEYLAYAEVAVSDDKGRAVLAARCPGAWLLLGLMPGSYQAKVRVMDQAAQTVSFVVPKTGQKSVVLHFPTPADGGDVSPEKRSAP